MMAPNVTCSPETVTISYDEWMNYRASEREIAKLKSENDRLRQEYKQECEAADIMIAAWNKWAYKTAGQTLPTASSQAILEFEISRPHRRGILDID